jgi:hypothetical protein
MAKTYINALQNHLCPFYEALTPDVKNGFIFQQDNTSIHTIKHTQQWFKETGIQVG